jgi:phosphatidylglycerol:prolipoprotein diacylglycerol transferase
MPALESIFVFDDGSYIAMNQPPIQGPWYIHNLDPIAFHIFGDPIPWYWLNYLVGFFFCWWILNRMSLSSSAQENRPSPADIAAFAGWSWVGMLLGARVFYILFYNLNWYKENPSEVFSLWNGGMSFHGGLLGIAAACWIVASVRRIRLFAFTDMLAVIAPWPLATGRLCNFINGELPGRPTDLSWAVIFPQPWDDFPRHPSQLYEGITEGLILGLIMLWGWRKFRSVPGLLSALFLAGYGSLRFLTEFTREPDPQLGMVLSGLTMGQLLCLLMILWAARLVARKANDT